jgi:hypothetical protein
MSEDAGPGTPLAGVFVLPKYIRFARSLALVSGAAVGIAAGALLTTSACTSCAGICGDQVYVPPRDAATDAVSGDARDASDASSEASTTDALPPDGGAGSGGGGPLPAPPMPPAWLS